MGKPKGDKHKHDGASVTAAEGLADRGDRSSTAVALKRNRGGRPRGSGIKLTPAVSDRICASISAGNFMTVACKLAGIDIDTLERWLKQGRAGREPYVAFAKKFDTAELECEAVLVKIWKDAAPQDWRGAKEFLAKRFPDRWSDHASRLAVLGPDDEAMIGGGGGLQIHINLGVFNKVEDDASPQPAIDVTPKTPPDKDPNPALN